MRTNKFIEEDWEHQYLRDEAYIEEGIRREIEEEWQEWEENQKRKPATILVSLPQEVEKNKEVENGK